MKAAMRIMRRICCKVQSRNEDCDGCPAYVDGQFCPYGIDAFWRWDELEDAK